MKKIIPFENINDAIPTLDNGGRFYNVLTKADDGQISTPELGKVAGVFNDRQKMVLYFVMAIAELEKQSKEKIKSLLSNDLKQGYEKFFPQILLSSEAELKGIVSSSAVITGVPKLIESKSDFNGFIMVPVSTGSVTTFTIIPIIDQYDVYEIRDNESSGTFLIAHSRGEKKLPKKKIRVGGILKELKIKKDKDEASKKFLDSLYYSDTHLS